MRGMTGVWRCLAIVSMLGLVAVGGCFRTSNGLDFVASPTEGPAPLVVSFSPVTSDASSGYEWEFGDGATSTDSHPTHTYDHTGLFTVRLTVTPTQGGPLTITKPSMIHVTGAGASPLVFWSERGRGEINAGDRDGGSREAIVDGLISPEDIAVSASRIYWTDYGTGKVESADVDGSNRTLLVTDQHSPTGIAVDALRGKVYWTCLPSGPEETPSVNGTIRRANLDGSDVEVLRTFAPDEPFAWQIAVDAVAGRLYWISLGWDALDSGACEARILVAGLDAAHPNAVVSGLCDVTDLTLDASASNAAGYVYWTSEDPGTLSSARINGQSVTQIVAGIPQAESLAVDPAAGRIYWTAGTTLQSAQLDGSDVTTLYSGLSDPEGIAIDR